MLLTPLIVHNPAVPATLPVWLIMAFSVCFSISAARQTMAARRRFDQATQDLRESEHSYRLLADNAIDVISLASASNERLYVSPSIERVLGLFGGKFAAHEGS